MAARPQQTTAHQAQSHAGGAMARLIDRGDADELDRDDEPEIDAADDDAEVGGRVRAQLVEADDGSMVRPPNPSVAYPGEPPYDAPVLGFHPKIAQLFDAFTYLPVNGAGAERPEGFLPIIGLIGDDPAKDSSPAWKLYGRIKPDVWKELASALCVSSQPPKPPNYVMVNAMRSENLAMFSFTLPQQIFAPSAWMAALPLSVMRTPMQTIDEAAAKMLALASKAKTDVAKAATQAGKNGQLSFSF